MRKYGDWRSLRGWKCMYSRRSMPGSKLCGCTPGLQRREYLYGRLLRCGREFGCIHVNNNADCTDDSLCTVNEECVLGQCNVETIDCDDGNQCTTDTCNSETGCTHVLSVGPCSDGDSCTVNDTCSIDGCHADPLDCDDGNPCTSDFCNPATGCNHIPSQGVCSDGNACTENDTCQGGSCLGTAVDCDDTDSCTTEVCDPNSGCIYDVPDPQCGFCSATQPLVCGGSVVASLSAGVGETDQYTCLGNALFDRRKPSTVL